MSEDDALLSPKEYPGYQSVASTDELQQQIEEAYEEKAPTREDFRLHDETKVNGVTKPPPSTFMKGLLFGGTDGLIFSFATVACAVGAKLAYEVIVIIGIANLAAVGFALGLGDFLSLQSDYDAERAQRSQKRRDLGSDRNYEIRNMIELYEEKGLSRSDAESVVYTLAKYEEVFLETILVESSGIISGDEEQPWKAGLSSGFGYALIGSVPLLPYLVSLILDIQPRAIQLAVSGGATFVFLLGFGALKARLTDQSVWDEHRNWLSSPTGTATTTCVVGAVSGMIAYLTGSALGYLLSQLPYARSPAL